MITADDISLTPTCYACPEQYDAYGPDGKQAGYLRLRHGRFAVCMPDAGGAEVYSAQPAGDGIFEPDEREDYLRTAREIIAHRLNTAREPAPDPDETESPRHPDAYPYGEPWGPGNPAPGSPWSRRQES